MKLRELVEAKAKILNESKDRNVMNVSVPFIQSDIKNLNGRIYKKSLLQHEIARVQGSVKRGSFIGAGDHPSSGLADIATSSHIVTALSLDENGRGTAELRILPTERGKTIQTLIRNNAQLGVSVRGFGEVGRDGIVSDSYRLVGLDIVTNPSFKNAVFNKDNIFESVEFDEEMNKEKPVQNLTEQAVQSRTYSYYQEAIHGGFIGSFDEWKTAFPKIVEQANVPTKIIEKKEEIREPFKSKITWDEVKQSGFRGTMNEWREKYPQMELILLAPPQKKVVAEKALTEKELKQEAARIFTEIAGENPNSSLQLEDIIKVLERDEVAKSDKRIRKQAIAIVSRDLDGSLSQEQVEKMVAKEIESLKEERKLRREKNWQAYKRLLSD